MLKTIDRHLADVETHLGQNKTVIAERAFYCFFETTDKLEEATEENIKTRVLG